MLGRARYRAGVNMPRGTLAGQLAAMGFADTGRARALIAELGLAVGGEGSVLNEAARADGRRADGSLADVGLADGAAGTSAAAGNGSSAGGGTGVRRGTPASGRTAVTDGAPASGRAAGRDLAPSGRPPADDSADLPVLQALAAAADPDLALATLARLAPDDGLRRRCARIRGCVTG